MECPKCGTEVNESDNFCEECGASLSKNPSGKKSEPSTFCKSEAYKCDRNLAAVTNIGRRHPTNEDACAAFKLQDGSSLLIVADGVSSSFCATSASQLAINVVKDHISKNEGNAEDLIKSSIKAADACIKELPYETRDDGVYGPEATIVAALVKNDKASIAWVGDSRAYKLNKDMQKLLTVDDSWVELVVSEGTMTREEAMQNKLAHCVTQVLGMHDQDIEIHFAEEDLNIGDMLLLCSDGLWNYFQDDEALLKAITYFGFNSDSDAICEYLVKAANSAGGHDNITAALLRIQ